MTDCGLVARTRSDDGPDAVEHRPAAVGRLGQLEPVLQAAALDDVIDGRQAVAWIEVAMPNPPTDVGQFTFADPREMTLVLSPNLSPDEPYANALVALVVGSVDP